MTTAPHHLDQLDLSAPVDRDRRPPLWAPFVRHTELDLKDFWRSPIQLAFIVAMPVMFYVIFGFAFRGAAGTEIVVGEHTLTQGNRSFAGVLAFGLLSVVFANVAISLAVKRHHGLFKRFRTTPVSPLSVMGGYLANIFVSLVLVAGVLTLIGVTALGVSLPAERVPALLLTVVLGFLCIAPLGVAFSLVPPNADSAVPLVNAVFFPVAFLSGAFMAMPFSGTVQAVVDLLPGTPLVQLLTGSVASTGPVWDVPALLLLAAWGVIGVVASVLWFSWASESEPRGFSRGRGSEDA